MSLEIEQRIDQILHGEVPEGYKKTAVGIIPSEWEIHPLSEHLSESRIPGTNGATAKKLTVKLWNKGVVEKREVHEGSESTTYYSRKSGQLIYSKLDFLNCAFGIIPQHLDGYESTLDLPCFDIADVNPKYLLTYITQKNFYARFGMIADGGRKARRVGPEDMLSFPLAYPNAAEQDKIMEILETQDRVIELCERKVEQLKKLKKVFLQKMFSSSGEVIPEWRFPQFTDAWEQRKLGAYCDITTGKLDANAMSPDGKFDFYTSGIQKYKIDIPAFEGPAITIAGNGATVGYMHLADGQFNAYQRTYVLTHFQAEREYLFYAIGKTLPKKIAAEARAGNIPYIVLEMLTDLEIPMTCSNEQQQIGALFKHLDALITLHQRKCDEEKRKKKALMQLLLKGIVRVKV